MIVSSNSRQEIKQVNFPKCQTILSIHLEGFVELSSSMSENTPSFAEQYETSRLRYFAQKLANKLVEPPCSLTV